MQNFDSVMAMAAATQQQSQQQQQTADQQQQTATPNGWFDLTIKSEPLDYHPHHHHPLQQHHHHHLHHHRPGGVQQDTTTHLASDSHSNPTSPQSVDSMDSLSGKSGFFEAKGANSLMSGGYNPLGFNPLTPPGYSGLLIPPPPAQLAAQQQQQQHQQHQQRLATPNRMYGNGTGKVELPTSLTPTHTPPMDVTPPKSPKESLETPTKEEDAGSDCEDGSYDGSEDEDGIRKPKVNSHGQVKKFRCKQCEFVAVTKLSFWEHTRSHIKPEKMLTCPKCPFVTEYKHHLEYHLRNHQRSKPFQCPKCSYSCVNKSMLNSHMKSHSNVFQYRCADCNYATKYCHSLKLHLRKYAHKPDVVLNLDGTPNPLPIIDVYGTRRGPKAKPQKNADKHLLKQEQAQQQQQEQQSQSLKQQELTNSGDQSPAPLTPLSQQGMATAPTTPFTPPGSGQTNGLMRNLFPHQLFPNPLAHMFKSAAANGSLPLFPYLNLNFQMFADQQAGLQQQQQQLSPRTFQQNLMNQLAGEKLNGSATSSGSDQDNDLSVRTSSSGSTLGEELLKHITAAAADSSAAVGRNALPQEDSESETTQAAPLQASFDEFPASVSSNPRTPSTTGKGERSRRKGRAFKLERLTEPATSSGGSNEMDTHYENGEESTVSTPVTVAVARESPAPPKERSLECKYCDIAFRDDVLYTIHMGYHGYDDVFKCNMCGEKSDDRIGFFLHIARKAH
uniref:Protein hunchback n=1 Tax=Anopheles quadriannulatus TaxID=34691 RepID=A0A182X0J4_ANOQN